MSASIQIEKLREYTRSCKHQRIKIRETQVG